MKILLIVNKYDLSGQMPYLTNELAEEFCQRCYDVTVSLLDWEGKEKYRQGEHRNGIKILHRKALKFSRKNKINQMLKWTISPVIYLSDVRKLSKSYDIVIFFSPLFVSYPVIFLRWLKKNCSICVYWDFFPYHQIQLGLLPKGPVGKILHRFEEFLLTRMSYIGLMSNGNMDAFKSLYPSVERDKIFHLPIWGNSRTVESPALTNVRHTKVCVFGGQLTTGRNLEALVEAARYLPRSITIKIIGDGPLRNKLQSMIEEFHISNVELIGKISRQEYLNRLAEADVGLIITEPGLKTHSFPSKVIDYFNTSKPVLAIVESGGDFGHFIEQEAKCGIACYSNHPQDIANRIVDLLNNPDIALFGSNGNQYFMNNMTTAKIADILINIYERN